VLRQANDFAKHHRKDQNSPLPREISTMLYYASIAAALTRCGQRITALSDTELCKAIEWAASQPWVDETTRALLQEGQAAQK
jgi:hypothetical protein